MKTVTLQELLIPENYIKGKQRLSESPQHLTLFEKKGFTRAEVMNTDVALSEDWRLYTPLVLMNMSAVWVFFISPSLSLGTYETIAPSYEGFIFSYDKEARNSTVIVVNTFAEFMYIKWRTTYTDIVLIPNNVYRLFFQKYKRIIFLHYDADKMVQTGRKTLCFFLTQEYAGEPLGIPEVVSHESYLSVGTNPFLYDGKLNFLIFNKTRSLIDRDGSYLLKKIDDSVYNAEHTAGTISIRAGTISTIFHREKYTTKEAFVILNKYLLGYLMYCDEFEVKIIAYFIMYCWVFPHFGQRWSLNIMCSSGQVQKLMHYNCSSVMPAKVLAYDIPCWIWNNTEKLQTPEKVPFIAICRSSNLEATSSGKLLYITSEYANRRLKESDANQVRNVLLNWAMDYEKENFVSLVTARINQEPIMDMFGWLVDDKNTLWHIRSYLEKSRDIAISIKKGEPFDHHSLIV